MIRTQRLQPALSTRRAGLSQQGPVAFAGGYRRHRRLAGVWLWRRYRSGMAPDAGPPFRQDSGESRVDRRLAATVSAYLPDFRTCAQAEDRGAWGFLQPTTSGTRSNSSSGNARAWAAITSSGATTGVRRRQTWSISWGRMEYAAKKHLYLVQLLGIGVKALSRHPASRPGDAGMGRRRNHPAGCGISGAIDGQRQTRQPGVHAGHGLPDAIAAPRARPMAASCSWYSSPARKSSIFRSPGVCLRTHPPRSVPRWSSAISPPCS